MLDGVVIGFYLRTRNSNSILPETSEMSDSEQNEEEKTYRSTVIVQGLPPSVVGG